jgi:hypothetical protein
MIVKKIFGGLIMLAMIVGFIATPTYGGDPARVGQAGGVQTLVPVSARDIAMAGANLALTSGLDAIYWNPAGLPRMKNVAAAQFSTITVFNDVHVNYLAAAYKSESLGSLGFSLKSFSFGDIPWTTNEDMDGESGRTFSPTFVTVGLTYARNLTESVNLGLTAKIINESVPRAAASAFAFDIGMQYDRLGGIDGVCFGVAIKNIGTNLRYEGSAFGNDVTIGIGRDDVLRRQAASNQLPTSIELGAAYKTAVAEDNNLVVSGVFQSNNFENDAMKLGLEYNYKEFIFVRGGYNYAQNVDAADQLNTFALGAGITYNVGGMDLTLDYAYRNQQYFNANNVFSLTIGF